MTIDCETQVPMEQTASLLLDQPRHYLPVWVDKSYEGLASSSVTPTSLIDHILGRLREFKFLPNNWNGYGGKAPTYRAVEDCIAFLLSLPLPVKTLPEPSVGGTGEVGLFWEVNRHQVEVGFTGDGKFGYAVIYPDGRAFENEGVPLSGLPEALGTGLDLTAYALAGANGRDNLPTGKRRDARP